MTQRAATVFMILLGLLCACVLLSLVSGPVRIPAKDVLLEVWNKALGNPETAYASVLFSIRLPRIAGACTAGWALSLAGLCYQSLLKNPLASEYTLGVASGAAVGAVCGQIISWNFPYAMPLFSFLGSTVSLGLILAVARSRFSLDANSLVLTGIIFTAFANAVLSLILSVISPNQLHTFFFWMMGSFAIVEWNSLISIVPLIVFFSAVIFFFGWEMNAISIGEDFGRQIGIPVARVRLVLFFAAGLLTALTVSITGTIGFIGLVVPHLGRLIAGPDNRNLFAIVPLLGALFCVLSDLLARSLLAPAELPVGVITAFVGVPVFLYFMVRR